jgi:hypothetical protein
MIYYMMWHLDGHSSASWRETAQHHGSALNVRFALASYSCILGLGYLTCKLHRRLVIS